MSLIVSKRLTSGEVQYRFAPSLSEVFGIGIAILSRGDELIHIAPNKDDYPISVEQIHSAKANRERYMRDGVRYEPLRTLTD
jgi:hypothetical protein